MNSSRFWKFHKSIVDLGSELGREYDLAVRHAAFIDQGQEQSKVVNVEAHARTIFAFPGFRPCEI